MNRFSDRQIWPLKAHGFCSISSGFMDFENTVDCGSAVNFGADTGLRLS